MRSLLLVLLLLSPAACAADPHSYAQPDQVRVTALDLELTVSMKEHTITGTARLSLQWADPAARNVVLDTRALTIDGVEGVDSSGASQPLKHALGDADPILGSPLTIELPEQLPTLVIRYRTSPDASGLQWLDPGQTAGKKHPFMYSQSEAIHARSWVPLQDTPSVRFPYTARVKVPRELRAVMSTPNDAGHPLNGDFLLEQERPIPSYLLAIAVGDIAVREVGPRSAVYAEPDTVEAAAREFSDTEKMIKTAEKLYGPYRWGRYDILVLPPSFPFGGMENPCLTFATPTVIAGDKSLVSVIAHELAHSWSGNLVTNADWADFWLNEGFTTYVQNRIVEALYGETQAVEEFLISVHQLEELMKELPAPDQRLVPELAGRDPDDNMNFVPYDKGMWLLRTLEASYGREPLDRFLHSYFDHFAFQSITTEEFAAYLKANLIDKTPDRMTLEQVQAWIHQPGIPEDAPLPRSPRFEDIAAQRDAWLAGQKSTGDLTAGTWNTQEWMFFLDGLPPKLTASQMAELDDAYHLTGTGNAEIAQRWYLHAIASDYEPAQDALRAYMIRVGRRYLVVPLYKALASTEAGKARAQEIYDEARAGYHPITRGTVEKILQ